GKIGKRRHAQLDRIAEQHGARRDHRPVTAAEAELAARAAHDGGTLVPQRDLRGTDRQRAGAIGVGDPYSQPFAADADARMHAGGVIVEAGEALCRRRRRRPGPNPFIAAAHGLLPSRLSRDGAAATVGPATVFVANTAGAVPAARAPPTAPGPRPQPW